MRPKAIVTDIEGTTTPIVFVKAALFPFARARIGDFIRAQRNSPEVAAALSETKKLMGAENSGDEAAVAALIQWIDEDRKERPLKFLQGLIWREGYESGALRAPVYPDAAQALRAWHGRGIALGVYSSGSTGAQKLLFAHTDHGDLTPLFSNYFDLGTGAKTEAGSYGAIAKATGFAPHDILFLSDHPGETRAAREAGLAAFRIDRDMLGLTDTARDEDGTMAAGSFIPVAARIGA